MESHRRAAAAWERGAYDDETVDVDGVELERDEPIRPDISVEKLAKLKPAFREDGSVTAGNSSPLNDGAAALLLADEAGVEAIGRDPLARIVSRGLHAVDPPHYGIAPVEAANQALERAGIGWGDVEVAELNEAFAAQALACVSAWGEVDVERLNVNGGAVALGHPIGCSGARILATLSWELPAPRRTGPGRAVHRRRPGHRDGAGGGVVAGYRRENADPPLLFEDYLATRTRAPKEPLVIVPQTLSELSGPVYGDTRVGETRPRPHPRSTRASRRASGSSSTAGCWTATAGPCRTR